MKIVTLVFLDCILLAVPANASMLDSGSATCAGNTCIWGPLGNPHVREVPPPTSAEDIDAQNERMRKWQDECHPTIVRGSLGESRYNYSKPGCEFGSPE